jgi:transcriptional regulator with XRE-family HTH domain
MLTSEQFIDKIEKILNYYKLSASQFAEKIGVQRSSLSHLLSGRNKPSLDFVIKIVEEFPEVDLYWFLFNQGSFPKQEPEKKSITENAVFENKKNENENIALNREILPLDLFSTNIDEELKILKNESSNSYQTNYIEHEPNLSNLIEEDSKNVSKEIQFINKPKTEIEQKHYNSESEIDKSNFEPNIIPKIETKHQAKVKKLMLLYDDGFFEEYNYR